MTLRRHRSSTISFVNGAEEFSLTEHLSPAQPGVRLAEIGYVLRKSGRIELLADSTKAVLWVLLCDAVKNPDPRTRLVQFHELPSSSSGSIHTQIKKLRRVLNDFAPSRIVRGKSMKAWTHAHVIQQVHKLGYRFMLPVNVERKSVKLIVAAATWSSITYSLIRPIEDGVGVLGLRTENFLHMESYLTFTSNEHLIRECGRINARAYRRQLWGGTEETLQGNIVQKTRRNRSHCQKNPYTIMLLKAFPTADVKPEDNHYIGLSHIVPLTDRGYERYLDGQIADNKLQPDVICEPGKLARALLLFSLGIDSATRRSMYRSLSFDAWKDQTAKMLTQAMAYHLYFMMGLHSNGEPIEILVQQNEGGPDILIGMKLAGLQNTGRVSADGCYIYTGTVAR